MHVFKSILKNALNGAPPILTYLQFIVTPENYVTCCKTPLTHEINELKTQAVIFGKKYLSNDMKPTYSFKGAPLKIVDSYCYLGIIVYTYIKRAQFHSLNKT